MSKEKKKCPPECENGYIQHADEAKTWWRPCPVCKGAGSSEARAGVSCAALVGVAGGACDRNVESVRAKLHQRAERGLSKYGVTTERTDLDTVQWLRHAQEEALDLAVYLERLIADHEAALAAPPPTKQIS